MVMTNIGLHIKVKGRSVQKLEWKRMDGQTDGRTDERTEAIALPPVLTQSLITALRPCVFVTLYFLIALTTATASFIVQSLDTAGGQRCRCAVSRLALSVDHITAPQRVLQCRRHAMMMTMMFHDV